MCIKHQGFSKVPQIARFRFQNSELQKKETWYTQGRRISRLPCFFLRWPKNSPKWWWRIFFWWSDGRHKPAMFFSKYFNGELVEFCLVHWTNLFGNFPADGCEVPIKNWMKRWIFAIVARCILGFSSILFLKMLICTYIACSCISIHAYIYMQTHKLVLATFSCVHKK